MDLLALELIFVIMIIRAEALNRLLVQLSHRKDLIEVALRIIVCDAHWGLIEHIQIFNGICGLSKILKGFLWHSCSHLGGFIENDKSGIFLILDRKRIS